MTDKIIPISFEPNKLAAAIEEYKRNMNYLIEFYEITAKLKYKQYESYVASGFTPEQALELCKT